MDYKEYSKKEYNLPYKKIEREEFAKVFKEYLRNSNERGLFKYLNISIYKDYFRCSINVKEGRSNPKFIDDYVKRRGTKRKQGTTYGYYFEDIKDAFEGFLGFKASKMYMDDKYIYFLGEDKEALEEKNEIIEKVEENKDDIRELIEAGLNLSDNPEEIEFIKLIAEKLLK